ncbi:MAG: molybdopterin converting factor subunit 1 [Methylococcaceae bacterium]|jgi:molybdopterin synthase sulfur carrier subunit
MSIKVRYFASLREKMGRVEETITADGIRTIEDIWKVVDQGRPLPEHLLCAVNMEYADAATRVEDGDEVAFFPPVTGG